MSTHRGVARPIRLYVPPSRDRWVQNEILNVFISPWQYWPIYQENIQQHFSLSRPYLGNEIVSKP